MRMTLTIAGVMLVGIILLVGCGSSANPIGPGAPVPGADVTITITGQNGSQSFLISGSVKEGQTVAWRNNDSVSHTATSNSGDSHSFDTGAIAPGASSAPIPMSDSGSFNYHCSFHPSMTGTLTVSSQ